MAVAGERREGKAGLWAMLVNWGQGNKKARQHQQNVGKIFVLFASTKNKNKNTLRGKGVIRAGGSVVPGLNKCISKYIYVLFYVYAAIKMMAQTVLLAAASEN